MASDFNLKMGQILFPPKKSNKNITKYHEEATERFLVLVKRYQWEINNSKKPSDMIGPINGNNNNTGNGSKSIWLSMKKRKRCKDNNCVRCVTENAEFHRIKKAEHGISTSIRRRIRMANMLSRS